MPFRTLKLLPGVNLIRSKTLNQTQLALSSLIRFYGGLPQKLGGWQQLSSQLFVGTARGLHGWADILGNPYIAVGTEQRLEVLIGGVINDLTPLVATTNPAVQFSTVISTPNVTILDAGYSPAAGDWVNILTQVAVGGLILFGYYQVTSVTSGTQYVINAVANATATVVNGGAVPAYTTTNTLPTVSVALAAHGFLIGSLFNAAVSTTVATVIISGIYSVTSVTNANVFVITAASNANATMTASENAGAARIQYLLSIGYLVDTPLYGYGVGDYGAGDYGTGGSGQIIAPLRQWSLDNWGQDLIASPTNGAIYYWQPPTPSPAVVVSGSAPLYNTMVFVMSQVQIILALGAETGGTQQPLLIRWCDAGDFTAWTASATNQAGSYNIPTGSRLVGGLAIGLGALVWTDVDLWSVTYRGLPFVFGFNRIATECGLVSQRAVGIAGTLVMWLSQHQFFKHSPGGGVEPMECPVWDFYWNNTDQTQFGQYFCAVNANFNEMAWFFPIATSSPLYNAATPFGYVKCNYVEGFIWDYGLSSQYQRSAWAGHSPIGSPVGADLVGLLQAHEIGMDANGVGMQWSWQTGFFDLMEGEEFAFADLLIPDHVTVGGPTIYYTIYATEYPNQTPTAYGPYATGPTTKFVPFRARGRQLAIGAAGSDLGTFNRLGALRYRYAMDGRN